MVYMRNRWDEDLIRRIKVGEAEVTVRWETDTDGYSMIKERYGYYCNDHKWNGKTPLYSRDADAIMMPGSDLWKDRKGRITRAPEENQYSRSYRFIQIEDESGLEWGKDLTLKDAFWFADRIEAYENGEWQYGGIVATVFIDDVEVASDSVWGIESGDDKSEIKLYSREMAREAIASAKKWLAKRKGSNAA